MRDDNVPRETPDGSESLESNASEANHVYLRFKSIFGDPNARRTRGRKRSTPVSGSSVPFGIGRDPRGLGDTINSLTMQLGWNSPLAQSELLASWAVLAGEETANHSTPVGIDDGVLTVHCESTAWATQLRLMRNVIMEHIATRYPDAGIQSIRFQGPNAPSWKKGPRSIPGRGPRDTYG
jgi:predicted nucleic acid-binding Zn ribbon protein